MQSKILITVFITSILILSNLQVFAQKTYDLSGIDISENAIDYFDQKIGLENTPIALGRFQQIHIVKGEGQPTFMNKSWAKGEMIYRGQYFDSINLIYDVADDYVLIQHPNIQLSSQPILLNQDQVEWFKIGTALFVNFKEVDDPGFYQVIHSGSSYDFIIKRFKVSSFDKNNKESYISQDDYYVLNVNGLNPISNISWFWKQNKVQKADLKAYVKNVKLPGNPRKCTVEQLRSFSVYVDQLTINDNE